MVIAPAEHLTVSPADRIMADRLAREIQTLIGGRSVVDAVMLLTAINNALATNREEHAAEPVRLH